MNKLQQIAWNELQSAYRVYCLPSIRANDDSKADALCAFLDKWEAAELVGLPLERSELVIKLK